MTRCAMLTIPVRQDHRQQVWAGTGTVHITPGLLWGCLPHSWLLLPQGGPRLYCKESRNHRGSWEPAPASLPRTHLARPHHSSFSSESHIQACSDWKNSPALAALVTVSQIKGEPSWGKASAPAGTEGTGRFHFSPEPSRPSSSRSPGPQH